MKLEGIHHVTAITADAPRNVDFYARVMGLRLVKKSVNQDDPTVYHLFYADEHGDPADLTFFEYPGVPPGQAGEGMVHRVVWRVASSEAQDFWAQRLADNETDSKREDDALVFFDPEGLEHELVVVDVPDPPLIAEHPEVPAEHALQGFHAVRAYGARPEVNARLFEEALGFVDIEGGWEASRAAASTSMTSRLSPARARARARCTTWPGRWEWKAVEGDHVDVVGRGVAIAAIDGQAQRGHLVPVALAGLGVLGEAADQLDGVM